ncbi:GIY-YIG nuclease family protein [Arthrobacter zhaoguopingii]|uniref:GIY-YIG nuclease family protein n=1 Tax=Arthrobacter zhaoguopingii TaxID=2681491 RepID=UPI003CCEB7C7
MTRAPGIYAWYFDELPPGVDPRPCHVVGDSVLLYIGIAPKEPPRNGGRPSTQTRRDRIRYHYRGNAYGSTLRLTLGCHLAETLGIALRRVGSGTRLTFTPDGERQISDWMQRHARVTWAQVEAPWCAETRAMEQLSLPLNLQGNAHHPYYPTLKALRAEHRTAARALPIA